MLKVKQIFTRIGKIKQVRLSQKLKSSIANLKTHRKWSPELIAKRLPKEEYCVSHETIYKWIWEAKHSSHRIHKAYKTTSQIVAS